MKKLIRGFVLGYAAGAASAYFLAQGKPWLKAQWWHLKIRMELARAIGKLEKFSRADYEREVEAVIRRYRRLGVAAASELAAFGEDLKESWREAKERFEEERENLEEEEGED